MTREQAFGAPEDKIDRGKGVLEGGRRGGNEGAGERVFEPRLQYGDENKKMDNWTMGNELVDGMADQVGARTSGWEPGVRGLSGS
ncbi:unnamed protein product [Fusarium graminearum]|uniref:Uncharacterized protein n=1 Tax=Gibberella zeae TaxID=5518 RepID=A0A4E9E676_GIBZA|nr:unnamed protein product [Fusarium graminearum]CAF3598720.1 unnamed protein product [Fusarium graminearum]CAG1975362.1 unnamed protein product [Fusarium graminearum]